MRRKLVTTVVAAAAMFGAGAVTAPAALAYGPSYCQASTCTLWNGSSPSSGHIYEVPYRAGVTMLCWTDNAWWNGTNRWFRVDTAYGRGYMNANQVGGQVRVDHC